MSVLRITCSTSIQLMTINVEGKLVGPWIDELRLFVAEAHARGAVCLNLEQLSFADAAGLACLAALRRSGILLVGASPLIEGLLAALQVSNAALVPANVQHS